MAHQAATKPVVRWSPKLILSAPRFRIGRVILASNTGRRWARENHQRSSMSKFILHFLVLFVLASIPVSGQALIGMPGEQPATSPPFKSAAHRPQGESIDWQHWVVSENFRYRVGSRYAGGTNWERYLELENTSKATLRFSGIGYGEARANDVILSPDNHSIQIKLVYGPVAKWSWNVIAYPTVQKPESKQP